MGAYGTSIFSEDDAVDVRDDYRDLIASGISDAQAKAQIQKSFFQGDPEIRKLIEPLFWLALARTQWEIGRLDEETKVKAIEMIDSGRDIERWRLLDASQSTIESRMAVLVSLRLTLLSPQKPRKKLRPIKRIISPYQVGDVISFKLSSGRLVLFRVTCVKRERKGDYPTAEILDWVGNDLPSEPELARLPGRRRIKPGGWGASMRFPRISLDPFPKEGFDSSRVTIVARGIPMPAVTSEGFTGYPWPVLENVLADDFGLR